MTFGKEVRTIRRSMGMTQQELASLVGYSQAAISLLETRQDEPAFDLAQAVVIALNTTVEDIRQHVRNAQAPDDASGSGQKLSSEEDLIELSEPTFGQLLRQKREDRKMSVWELSRESSVTANQINNLETGMSINPQKATIERLERVLGPIQTKRVEMAMEEQSSIPNLGLLEDFDPYDENTFPSTAGVYVLYDRVGRPVYIGQSGDVKRRLGEHSKIKWFIKPVVNTGVFIQVEDESRRIEIEQLLIKIQRNHILINKKGVIWVDKVDSML